MDTEKDEKPCQPENFDTIGASVYYIYICYFVYFTPYFGKIQSLVVLFYDSIGVINLSIPLH